MTGPSASCELWVNGVRVPDTGGDLLVGQPTALSGLGLTWGRDGPFEQPGPATCSFTIADRQAESDFLDRLHVGSPVEVWAAGLVPGTGAPPSLYPGGGGFGSKNDGPVPAQDATVDTPDVWLYAAHTLRSLPPPAVTPRVVGTVAPQPFNLAPTDPPDVWDALPRAAVGETWSATLSVKAPVGRAWSMAVQGRATPYKADPVVAVTVTGGGTTYTGTGAWQTVTETWTVTGTGGHPLVWLHVGIAVDNTVPAGDRWSAQTTTWATDPRFWSDTTLYLDDVALYPPTAFTARRVLVFAGEVSDVEATPTADPATLNLAVTAADLAADLGNRVVGDDPWPVQTITDRTARIVQLAGLPAGTVRIDDPLGAFPVSARDVDAQPVFGLLQDLAQSAGGVLWAATHATTGAYLWMENPGRRAAAAELALVGGVITVVDAPTGPTAPLSACDLLAEPVAWVQDTGDVSTVVAVTWAEQGVDGDGLPTTTDRTVTVSDPAGVAEYGTRRMSISTELTQSTDAELMANRVIVQARAVGWRITGVTLDTATMPATVPSMSDGARADTLFALLDGTARPGRAVTLVDMPAYAPRGVVDVYVEGGEYAYTGGWWSLALTVTPTSGQGDSATWAQLEPAWTWADWEWSLTWQDLYGVSA